MSKKKKKIVSGSYGIVSLKLIGLSFWVVSGSYGIVSLKHIIL
jgi:hypothetical protein